METGNKSKTTWAAWAIYFPST